MKRNLIPSHALGTVERGFGQLFEDLANGFGTLTGSGEGRRILAAMDLVESQDAWRLTVDLPGVAEEDLELTIEDGVLEISARRPAPELGEGEQARHVERAAGSFGRRLRLPGEVEVDQVEAHLEDGVLNVALPKATASRARRIQVQRG